MERIRYQNTGGPVLIELAIESNAVYKYVYFADDKTFRGDDSGGGSHTHVLGLPSELRLDSNRWSIRLGSPTGNEEPYVVIIKWIQDGETLTQWQRVGVLKATVPTVEETGSAILIGTDQPHA